MDRPSLAHRLVRSVTTFAGFVLPFAAALILPRSPAAAEEPPAPPSPPAEPATEAPTPSTPVDTPPRTDGHAAPETLAPETPAPPPPASAAPPLPPVPAPTGDRAPPSQAPRAATAETPEQRGAPTARAKRHALPERPSHASDGRLRTAPARVADAHYDHVILVPTAETHPEGSFYLSSYEIVLLQIGYAVSDSTQISLTSAPPIAEGTVPLDVSAKTVLLRESSVQAAFFGSATGVVGSELAGFLGRAGGAVTLCHPAYECRHRVTVASSVFLAGPASMLVSGVGASFRVNRMFTLLAELDSAVPLGEPVGEFNGILGGVAARFSDPNWGVDLGLLRSGSVGTLSPFVPWLAFTYRYVP